ncbi:hypothetical protein [Ehrlichia ruminantium]|nr:hypothetical protein [Ehrlichia ruminantium]
MTHSLFFVEPYLSTIVNISFLCLVFKINSVLSSLYISNNKYDLLIVGMG